MVIPLLNNSFDSIWHDGLIHKLIKKKFPAELIQIIYSFLQNRSFFVQIKNSKSDVHNIPAGVPQGSSLSPVLYILYSADFPIFNEIESALFADDTAIYYSHEYPTNIISFLETALATITKYFHKWKIKTNDSKTRAMFFNRRRANRYLPSRNLFEK